MNTVVFIVALLLSFFTVNNYIGWFLDILIGKKAYNLKYTLIFGILAITTWGLFYYLTHK